MTHYELNGETDFSRDLFDVEGMVNAWGNGFCIKFLNSKSPHKIYVFIKDSWIKIESDGKIEAIESSGSVGFYNIRTWSGEVYKISGDTPLMWLDGTQEFDVP